MSLVFFRLPSAATEDDGGDSWNNESLKKSWIDDKKEIQSRGPDSQTYTRESLIEKLRDMILAFGPDRLSTLDSTGRTICDDEAADPSRCKIWMPGGDGGRYFYDHTDHYYSAVFALAAYKECLLKDPDSFWSCQFRRYRGYNTGLDDPNLSGVANTRKTEIFAAYAADDSHASPSAPLYVAWIARQYQVEWIEE